MAALSVEIIFATMHASWPLYFVTQKVIEIVYLFIFPPFFFLLFLLLCQSYPNIKTYYLTENSLVGWFWLSFSWHWSYPKLLSIKPSSRIIYVIDGSPQFLIGYWVNQMYTCTVIKPKLSGQALRPEVFVTQEAETAGFLVLIFEDKPRQNSKALY